MNGGFFASGEFYSAFCAVLWAVAVVLFRKCGEQVGPVALNLFKNVVGLVLFLATMLVLGLPLVPRDVPASDWIVLAASGAIGIGIADSLFFASLNRLGAGRSAIVDSLYSPLVILCSFLYLDFLLGRAEPIGTKLILAAALMVGAIFVGAWQPEPLERGHNGRRLHVGVALGVVSMALMAFGIVLAKPVLGRTGSLWAATVRLTSGVALLLVQGLLSSDRAQVLRVFRPGRMWALTVPAAVVGAYLAMIFWIMGMKHTYTTVASVLNQLSTVFTLVFATVFLSEKLTWRKVLAILMGFAGGVLATL